MISYLKSENLKFKRTFSRKFIFLAPVFIAIFVYIVFGKMIAAQKFYSANIYNWWSLFFVTLGGMLFCMFSVLKDKKTYLLLISRGIDIKMNWISKILIVIFYLLISHIWLFTFFEVTNYFLFGSFFDISNFFYATILDFLASISLVPLNLFLEYKTSTLLTFVINFIGLIAGIKFSPTFMWFVSPWGYALRFMCPILGMHPNGVFLEPNSYLMDKNILIPGIALCVFIFTISAYITAILIDNKEGK